MNDQPPTSDTPGSDGGDAFASDVDPRFDDAAIGTGPPRATDPLAGPKSAQQQFAEATAAASDWVRGKPMQALAVAAGIGFLLGRSGR